jgi:hypothetical protein
MTSPAALVGETPAGTGATYVVVDQYTDDLNIQCQNIGTVTYSVQWTNQNIFWDTAALKAVNVQSRENTVNPFNASYEALIGSTVDDSANAQISYPIKGLRINITAGTGSVRYRITQA